jgi:LysR family transcriptional activator of glutamate synthase operon
MDIRDLRCFCLTAELEHVSKAADKLGIAQPYLTKIIGQIENEFDTELFEKAGRKIRLSNSGEIFYKNARKILAEVDKLYIEMDFALKKQRRLLSIISNTEAHSYGMIIEFQKRNANYALKISFGTKKEMLEALITRAADVALCDPPIDADPDKNIVTEVVFRDTACVLLPPGHPLLNRKSIRLEELQGERLVAPSKGGAMRNHLDYVFEKYSVYPNIVCETYNLNLIIQAVQSGLGYAFESYSVLETYPELKQYCVEIDNPDKYGYMGLSYSSLSSDNRNMEDFLSFSRDYFHKLQKRVDDLA